MIAHVCLLWTEASRR